ncbi:MAG: histidinol-phosphatase [Armatimonadota bacterium]
MAKAANVVQQLSTGWFAGAPKYRRSMLTFDHHTHHERCGHARGTIEEYVEAALSLGMREIGVTDHAPIYFWDGDHVLPGTAMARSELPRYVDEVLELKRRYAGRIDVLLGLEVDYAPGFEELYREVLSAYPFDYLIGSVHFVGDVHIYDQRRWREGKPAEEQHREYFRLVRDSARSGLFDVLGHITGILAFGPAPDPALLEEEFAETARVLAGAGVGIEINTSAIRKGGSAPFPDERLLRRCVDAGVPLTYGSDSHAPEEVGFARERAAEWLSGAARWRPGAEAAILRRSTVVIEECTQTSTRQLA